VRGPGEFACQCFGADGGPLSGRHLVRNGVLLLVATCGLVLASPSIEFPVPQVAACPAVLAGVVGGVLLTRWDDLAFLVVGPSTGLETHRQGGST
jgi:hypothetical protein